MTKATVLKPFHTRSTRYKPGDQVTRADFDGHGFDLAHAQEKGFVGPLEDNTPAPTEVSRKAKR